MREGRARLFSPAPNAPPEWGVGDGWLGYGQVLGAGSHGRAFRMFILLCHVGLGVGFLLGIWQSFGCTRYLFFDGTVTPESPLWYRWTPNAISGYSGYSDEAEIAFLQGRDVVPSVSDVNAAWIQTEANERRATCAVSTLGMGLLLTVVFVPLVVMALAVLVVCTPWFKRAAARDNLAKEPRKSEGDDVVARLSSTLSMAAKRGPLPGSARDGPPRSDDNPKSQPSSRGASATGCSRKSRAQWLLDLSGWMLARVVWQVAFFWVGLSAVLLLLRLTLGREFALGTVAYPSTLTVVASTLLAGPTTLPASVPLVVLSLCGVSAVLVTLASDPYAPQWTAITLAVSTTVLSALVRGAMRVADELAWWQSISTPQSDYVFVLRGGLAPGFTECRWVPTELVNQAIGEDGVIFGTSAANMVSNRPLYYYIKPVQARVNACGLTPAIISPRLPNPGRTSS